MVVEDPMGPPRSLMPVDEIGIGQKGRCPLVVSELVGSSRIVFFRLWNWPVRANSFWRVSRAAMR